MRSVILMPAGPDRVALDDLVDHAGPESADHLARTVVHEVARRARAGTGAALLTDLDLLAGGHSHDVVDERLVHGFGLWRGS